MLGSVDMSEDERAGLKSSPNAAFSVVIAGAGIGGLVLAVSLLKRGFSVKVLERDLTAVRGEGKYRGPIQVRCAGGGWLHLGCLRLRSHHCLCCRRCRATPWQRWRPSTVSWPSACWRRAASRATG